MRSSATTVYSIRRRGKPSPKRVPLAQVEQVLGLYRERYSDLNVQHFHEKLKQEHQIDLSYSWVKRALQGAGLVRRDRKRGPHRKQRARRPLPGMLVHIDGSEHRWFQDERWYDLIVILDDANSEIYYAQLVEEESTVSLPEPHHDGTESEHFFTIAVTATDGIGNLGSCSAVVKLHDDHDRRCESSRDHSDDCDHTTGPH